jgi:hypothetical protein
MFSTRAAAAFEKAQIGLRKQGVGVLIARYNNLQHAARLVFTLGALFRK